MVKLIRKHKKGMTLIETLVASAIAVFAILGLLDAYFSNIYLSDLAKGATVAFDDLTDMMEKIKATPFNELTSRFPNGALDGPTGNKYNSTVVGNYSLKNEHIVVTYINLTADPLEMIVNVSWQDLRGRQHSNFLTTKKTR